MTIRAVRTAGIRSLKNLIKEWRTRAAGMSEQKSQTENQHQGSAAPNGPPHPAWTLRGAAQPKIRAKAFSQFQYRIARQTNRQSTRARGIDQSPKEGARRSQSAEQMAQ